ncbi:hypothetical protein J6590_068176 [Homalodisca vitripennis]|nr:hypothetical protein J6590_068176 [Homalodisca vitripennis]
MKKKTFNHSNTLSDHMTATSSITRHPHRPPQQQAPTPATKCARSSLNTSNIIGGAFLRQASTVKDLLKYYDRWIGIDSNMAPLLVVETYTSMKLTLGRTTGLEVTELYCINVSLLKGELAGSNGKFHNAETSLRHKTGRPHGWLTNPEAKSEILWNGLELTHNQGVGVLARDNGAPGAAQHPDPSPTHNPHCEVLLAGSNYLVYGEKKTFWLHLEKLIVTILTNTEMVFATLTHRHDLKPDNSIHLETVLANAFIQEQGYEIGSRVFDLNRIDRKYFTAYGQHLTRSGKRPLKELEVESLAGECVVPLVKPENTQPTLRGEGAPPGTAEPFILPHDSYTDAAKMSSPKKPTFWSLKQVYKLKYRKN